VECKWRHAALAILLLAVGLAALLPYSTSSAEQKKYAISQYDILVLVMRNGTLRFRERITFQFVEGTFTYAFRKIYYTGFDDIVGISVRGEGCDVEKVEVEDGGTYVVIKWYYPQVAAPADRTFVLEYSLTNALGKEGSLNVLDWNYVGDEHECWVRNLNITVVLPEGIEPAEVLTDPEAEAVASENGTAVVSFFCNALEPGEPYRAIVKFPLVYEPKLTWVRLMRERMLEVGLAIAAATTLIVAGIWYLEGREPKVELSGATYAAVLERPSDLKPAEVGFLLKQRLLPEHLAALALDLARRGFVELKKEVVDRALLGKKTVVRFNVTEKGLQELSRPGELEGYELVMLRILHESGSSENMVSKRSEIVKISKAVERKLCQLGLFSSPPSKVTAKCVLAGAALLVAGAVVFAVPLLRKYALGIGVGLVLSGVPVIAAARVLPRLSKKGAMERVKWKTYLEALKNSYLKLKSMSLDRVSGFEEDLPFLVAALPPEEVDEVARNVEKAMSSAMAGRTTYVHYGWYARNYRAVPSLISLLRSYMRVAGGTGAGGRGGGGGGGVGAG